MSSPDNDYYKRKAKDNEEIVECFMFLVLITGIVVGGKLLIDFIVSLI